MRGEIKIADKFSGQPDTVATSIQKPLVFANPAGMTDHAAAAKLLAPILGMTEQDILDKTADTSKKYVVLKRGMSDEDKAKVTALKIPGIRKWPEAYLPKIYDKARVDQEESVSQSDAEHMARRMAAEEGIFCGISAAGACEVALRIAHTVENATIVFIVCDRGDRYLSTGVFPA